jgi:hypothetical protein
MTTEHWPEHRGDTLAAMATPTRIHEGPRPGKPTWDELAKLEPLLIDLLKLAESYPKRSPGFCANAAWYGYGAHGLKDALCKLVGWIRKPKPNPGDLLGGKEAYEVAYDTLYAALPDCQHPEGFLGC